MPLPVNPNLSATELPPVMEARRWIEGKSFPPARPLINVSQAAPVEIPPLALRQALAEAALNNPDAHLYGAVLGLDGLRSAIAAKFSATTGGRVSPGQVGVTQGCNQAFCAVMAALAGPGDEVILPVPWYFNHKMWLDMAGVTTLALETGPDLIPDPEAARALITPRSRAIVLVTPNNPGGVEYPPETLAAFRDLARAHGLALVIDETYRDFDSRWSPASGGVPHDLLQDPAWDDTTILLYSFSKAYRLTGHRVGAVIAAQPLLAEIEKFLDTVAICPGQLGQIGALWGMENLGGWLEGERQEILARRQAMIRGFAALKGWKLIGCGAYFAWVEHPFELSSDQLCRQLVDDLALLMLPGSYFAPEGTRAAQKQIRIAFANIDCAGIATLFERLQDYSPAP
ncbi:aminotransferase [Pseudogemmobacter faecipullorum]|uniref:aspartate transaminase n=1 Tax=Pseudogemmobacter faecipullorum TaxID=2755041 RepID=A0ABS8CQ77_9RHOB|nr:aminotransferase [Pseudogemmobacter faecipullorum]MCB5411524.1 aminotransferase [Pseudogemmobacter faecipullorum]